MNKGELDDFLLCKESKPIFRRRRDVEPSSPTPPPSLAAASSGNRHLPLSMICMSGSKINLVFILWIAIEVQRRLCHVQTMWVCVSSSVFRVHTDRKLCLTFIFWLIFCLYEYWTQWTWFKFAFASVGIRRRRSIAFNSTSSVSWLISLRRVRRGVRKLSQCRWRRRKRRKRMVMRRKRRRKQEMQPIRESRSYGEGVNVRDRKGASVNVISVI